MWFKVDDYLHMHAKVVQAGNASMGLWVRAGSWAAQNLTNGNVPTAVALALGDVRQAQSLVSCGLWDTTPEGFRFHDWHEFQPSSEEVEQLRAKRSASGRKGADKRWGREASAMASAMPTAMANGWQTDAPSPSPSPIEPVVTSSRQARVGDGPFTDDDLDQIARATSSDRTHAERVAGDILARATTSVRKPLAFVLRSIGEEPERYRPTHTAPSIHALCDHGLDGRTCHHCKREAATA